MRSFIASTVLALAASVVALPTLPKFTNCPVEARPDLPKNQTTLTDNTALKVQFVGLGMGIQNYTCSSATNTYASIGAVATLYDVSCLVNTPIFKTLPATALKLGGLAQKLAVNAFIRPTLGSDPFLLGHHFFITNPVTGTGVVPTFVFNSTSVVATKSGDLVSPVSPTVNVDYLQLAKQSGNMGTIVYRLDTAGGQPPASCNATTDTAVKTVNYSALYWFMG